MWFYLYKTCKMYQGVQYCLPFVIKDHAATHQGSPPLCPTPKMPGSWWTKMIWESSDNCGEKSFFIFVKQCFLMTCWTIKLCGVWKVARESLEPMEDHEEGMALASRAEFSIPFKILNMCIIVKITVFLHMFRCGTSEPTLLSNLVCFH